jgi:hypothetical protein
MNIQALLLAAAAFSATSAAVVAGEMKKAIPFDQTGPAAGNQYTGEGLSITRSAEGAILRCVFQKMEGRVTRDGLWLTATTGTSNNVPFRVIAESVGREHGQVAKLQTTGDVQFVSQTARFHRAGLDEEYTVSVDGVRQDFVLTSRPAGDGALRVQLKVDGARVEAAPDGVQLVLSGSGRKLAYNRLKATDANGRELAARMEGVEQKSKIENRKSKILVLVEDAAAVYPVRIDPTFSNANWIVLPGTDGQVNAVVVDGSGNLCIGGRFTMAGNTKATNVAKWNGSGWSALGPGFYGYVYALAASGSKLYVASDYEVAQWDGTNWSALGPGPNGSVYALAVSAGTLYAGGEFTQAGVVNANNIAQWDGTNWLALSAGFNGDVDALAVSGGTLYAGGRFTTAGYGTVAKCIAEWDGSSWSALGSGIFGSYSPSVDALAVSGGTLYAGGGFTTAGGNPATNIAQWNGSSWSPLGSGTENSVLALAVSGGTLYAGGGFSSAGGMAASNIAQWDGRSWSALGSGVNNFVNALAVSGGMLYVGGDFTTAGGKVAAHAAGAVLDAVPVLDQAQLANGQFQFTVNGPAGSNTVIYANTNLATGPWVPVATNGLGIGSLMFTDPLATNYPARFYRAELMP